MVKNTCRDQGTALINVDPRSKQANLPKLLATRLAQTRVLKYNVENNKLTINIKNISARSKTGNISILLIKKIILLIAWALPSKEISITEKPVNQFAFQTTWQVSNVSNVSNHWRDICCQFPSHASNHWRDICCQSNYFVNEIVTIYW